MNFAKTTVNDIHDFYAWTLRISDPRVADWPLMRSVWPTLILTLAYIVTVIGGKWIMKNRLPYKLQHTLIIYNFMMIILNLHVGSELFIHSWNLNYNYLCQPLNSDPSNIEERKIAEALWWFYMSKLIEFLDTIFFVLRKKNDQISFLHIYHHATMFPIWWIGVKWIPGGSAFLGPMINSFVHVVMYSYYGMSVLSKSWHRFLAWKKYVTRLQLIQFLIGMLWGLNLVVNGCAHIPRWMIYVGILYGISMITLFLNFYYRAYTLKGRLPASTASSTQINRGRNAHNGLMAPKKTY